MSESLVDDSVEFLKKNEFVTIGLLERNLGIGAPRADRLFHVLIARGIIDREGKRIQQPAKEEATEGKPAAEQAPTDNLESLMPQVLNLLRTEKAISVSLLEERLQIGFARAIGLRVFGYSCREMPFAARTIYYSGMEDDAERDVHGYQIERFGLVDNLMIDGGIGASGGKIVCVESDDLSAFAAFEQLVAEIARAHM